jgi:hypothetical protein
VLSDFWFRIGVILARLPFGVLCDFCSHKRHSIRFPVEVLRLSDRRMVQLTLEARILGPIFSWEPR